MRKSALGDSVPRGVGSIVLRDVGFGVTGWYSGFGGGCIFSVDSIWSFRSGLSRYFVSE